MSGLQGYLEKRQHTLQDSQRQDIQKHLKVSVPVTKLEHRKTPSLTLRPSQSLVGSRPPAQQGSHRQLGFQSGQTSNGQGDGFDTDAEGLDDTTVTSSTYDSGVNQSIAPGNSHDLQNTAGRINTHYQSFVSFDSDNRRFDHLRAEHVVTVGDSESDEESGEEDGEGYEEEDLTREVMKGVESPGYLRFRQQGPSLLEKQVLKEMLEANAPHDHNVKNVESTSSRTTNFLARHLHSAGGNAAPSGIDPQLQQSSQPKAYLERNFSSQTQQSKDGPIKRPTESGPRTALQPTLSVEQPSFIQTSAESSKPQPSKSQPQQIQHPVENPEGTTIKERHSFEGQDSDMSPPLRSNDIAVVKNVSEHHDKDLQRQIKREAVFPSKSHSDANGNNISVSEEPGLDTGDSVTSTTPKRVERGQKRGRDLDYSTDQLANMGFQQLKDEAFHIDPQASSLELPPEITGSALVGKLDYLLKVEDRGDKSLQQGAFLKSLPIEEYEECGDIIVEKFGELVKRFKNARRERRKAAKEFEEEVARREESIRGKMDAFEKDFSRLKQSGEDVVRKRIVT